jgi:hypothetical protein
VHIKARKGKLVDKGTWEGDMTNQSIPPLIDFFMHIKDLRIEGNNAYPLIEVIVITLLVVMAFAEGWEDNKK